MKHLHVIAGLQKAAGTSVFCVELCNHLARQGEECHIAVRKRREGDYLPDSAVSLFAIEDNSLSSLSFRPDIVHIHALWDPFLHRVSAWARRAALPVIYSPHGMLTPWALGQKRIKKALALAAYQYRDLKFARMLHATANSEVQDIRRLGLRQPVVVAPLGVAVESVLPRRIRRDSEPRIALFVSRVHPKKGLANLVEAWAAIKPCGWKMVIAGPDQDGHEREIKDLAEDRGVAQDFEFVGAVFGKEKECLYNQADLFVLPTHSENFGVVVLEALAAGVPVITTKGAPWSELQGYCDHPVDAMASVKQNTGRAGWWIDIGVEPLAEALKEAMGLSDDERRAMGENGRRLVEAKYTWSAIAEQMKAAYAWIVNGGEKPDGVVSIPQNNLVKS